MGRMSDHFFYSLCFCIFFHRLRVALLCRNEWRTHAGTTDHLASIDRSREPTQRALDREVRRCDVFDQYRFHTFRQIPLVHPRRHAHRVRPVQEREHRHRAHEKSRDRVRVEPSIDLVRVIRHGIALARDAARFFPLGARSPSSRRGRRRAHDGRADVTHSSVEADDASSRVSRGTSSIGRSRLVDGPRRHISTRVDRAVTRDANARDANVEANDARRGVSSRSSSPWTRRDGAKTTRDGAKTTRCECIRAR